MKLNNETATKQSIKIKIENKGIEIIRMKIKLKKLKLNDHELNQKIKSN